MNALQMVNELLSRFGLTEVGAFSGTVGNDDTIALRKINLAQSALATSYPFSWTEHTAVGTITAVLGTSTYSLSAAVGRVARLLAAKHTYNGGGIIEVTDRATLERYRPRRTETQDYGVTKYLTTFGKTFSDGFWHWNVEIYPVPDSNFNGQTITYYYLKDIAELTTATEVSIVPIEFHNLLIDQAELFWRTGVLRSGGDQGQIDLYATVLRRVEIGMKSLIAADSTWTNKALQWDVNSPDL